MSMFESIRRFGAKTPAPKVIETPVRPLDESRDAYIRNEVLLHDLARELAQNELIGLDENASNEDLLIRYKQTVLQALELAAKATGGDLSAKELQAHDWHRLYHRELARGFERLKAPERGATNRALEDTLLSGSGTPELEARALRELTEKGVSLDQQVLDAYLKRQKQYVEQAFPHFMESLEHSQRRSILTQEVSLVDLLNSLGQLPNQLEVSAELGEAKRRNPEQHRALLSYLNTRLLERIRAIEGVRYLRDENVHRHEVDPFVGAGKSRDMESEALRQRELLDNPEALQAEVRTRREYIEYSILHSRRAQSVLLFAKAFVNGETPSMGLLRAEQAVASLVSPEELDELRSFATKLPPQTLRELVAQDSVEALRLYTDKLRERGSLAHKTNLDPAFREALHIPRPEDSDVFSKFVERVNRVRRTSVEALSAADKTSFSSQMDVFDAINKKLAGEQKTLGNITEESVRQEAKTKLREVQTRIQAFEDGQEMAAWSSKTLASFLESVLTKYGMPEEQIHRLTTELLASVADSGSFPPPRARGVA